MKRSHATSDGDALRDEIGPIGANSKKPRIIAPRVQSGGSFFRRVRRGAKRVGKDIAKAVPRAAVSTALGPTGSLVDAAVGDRFKKREAGKLPPAVRNVLEKQGDTVVTSIRAERTPLDMATNAALNAVTLGAFDKAVKQSGYDRAFHLALIINEKFVLDKQEVIKLSPYKGKKKTSEERPIPLQKSGVTIREMLDKTRERMGDSRFTNYDARSNNCQDFVIAVLEGNGLMPADQETRDFIKQDATAIFKKLPKGTAKIARAVTDVAAKANRLFFGSGEGKKKRGEDYGKYKISKPDVGGKFESGPSGSYSTS